MIRSVRVACGINNEQSVSIKLPTLHILCLQLVNVYPACNGFLIPLCYSAKQPDFSERGLITPY